MDSKKRVVLRADANNQIATGHVFRLLALAEMLSLDFELIFCIQNTAKYILELIKLQVDQLIILSESFDYRTANLSKPQTEISFDLEDIITENDIVIADGYWFKESYQLAVKEKGARLVMIDDFGYLDYHADAVINHAPSMKKNFKENLYRAKFYYGMDYALLRDCFYKASNRSKSPSNINKVFICFGGGNQDAIIQKIFSALDKMEVIEEVHIVTNSPQKFKSSKSIQYYSNLSSLEISEVMRGCELSICPSSTIAMESFFVKMYLLTGLTAINQTFIHKGLITYENVSSVGDWNMVTEELIQKKLQLALDSWSRINDVFNYSFDNQKLLKIFKEL